MVGTEAAGRPSEAIFEERGEIKFLYVDPDFKRRGVGRSLLAQVAILLEEHTLSGGRFKRGQGKEPAIAFYETLNGSQAGEYIDPGPIWRSQTSYLCGATLQV